MANNCSSHPMRLRYGDGVSPPHFGRVWGPEYCLIFGSRNAYFVEFYGPFKQYENISEKNNIFVLS